MGHCTTSTNKMLPKCPSAIQDEA
ncbi:hypothetical protein Goklo_000548, partial [Gossypium klotzschianum]|nr:hypothetical protein [Gossypium klotzschianum]